MAWHLGNPEPTDSLATALVRGLGYDSGRALLAALEAKAGTPRSADLDQRLADGMQRLFPLPDRGEGEDIAYYTKVGTLFAAMPSAYQIHPFLERFDLTNVHLRTAALIVRVAITLLRSKRSDG